MDKMVLIKNFPNRAFAEQAKDILERNEIICVLNSPDVGILGTATGGLMQGVNLYVSATQAEKAAHLVDALYNGI